MIRPVVGPIKYDRQLFRWSVMTQVVPGPNLTYPILLT